MQLEHPEAQAYHHAATILPPPPEDDVENYHPPNQGAVPRELKDTWPPRTRRPRLPWDDRGWQP